MRRKFKLLLSLVLALSSLAAVAATAAKAEVVG